MLAGVHATGGPAHHTTRAMPIQNIVLNEQTYAVDSLSDTAKQLVALIQACDAEISQSRARATLADTARQVYMQKLQAELPQA